MNPGTSERRALAASAVLLALGAGSAGCSLVLDSEHYRPASDTDASVALDAPIADVTVATDQLPGGGDGQSADVPADTIVALGDAGDDAGTSTGWHVPAGLPSLASDAFRAVWERGPGDVYVGGRHSRMLHLAGSTWTAERLPLVPGVAGGSVAPLVVRAIVGDDMVGVWAVCAYDDASTPLGAILRRTSADPSGSWQLMTRVPFRPAGIAVDWPQPGYNVVAAEDGTGYLFDVTHPNELAEVLTTGPRPLTSMAIGHMNALWIVGASPFAQRDETGLFPLVLVPNVGLTDVIEDVSLNVQEPERAAVVSDQGTLAVLEYGGWRYVPHVDIGRALRGVYVSTTPAIVAVGDHGTIVRSDFGGAAESPTTPRSWLFDDSTTTRDLYDVAGTSDTTLDVYAVGDATILHLGAD